MKRVLFVCIGNICRSPAQQYVFQEVARRRGCQDQFFFDSCGMSEWHKGSDVFSKMRRAAEKKGYDFPRHVAKVFCADFFATFDYIFAVTREIYEQLRQLACTDAEKEKVFLASHFSKKYRGKDVLDPYYEGQKDFDAIFSTIEEIAEETIDKWLT